MEIVKNQLGNPLNSLNYIGYRDQWIWIWICSPDTFNLALSSAAELQKYNEGNAAVFYIKVIGWQLDHQKGMT